VYIGKIDGCFSDVGRAGGRQELSLANGCLEYDTAIHELMHAVGFYHEHERWDRDGFIDIQWQNIDRDAYDQFGRVDLIESSYYDQQYDYFSVMHYDREAFSKNGQDTIKTRDTRYNHLIGHARDFSPIDLSKINSMYQCSNAVPNTQQVITPAATPSPWSVPFATPPLQPVVPAPVVNNNWNTNVGQGQCRDQATLCWKWLDRCSSPFFERIMREFCSLSCGFCSPALGK
jgi:hypothetical protein